MTIKLVEVISGGQTGADQAALYAAEAVGLRTGGWAPHGWVTNQGPSPELLRDRFHLREHVGNYQDRTWANVYLGDATLVLAVNLDSPGTRLTVRMCQEQRKPYITVDLRNPASMLDSVFTVVGWVASRGIAVLNVAGNRQTRGNDVFTLASSVLLPAFTKLVNLGKKGGVG